MTQQITAADKTFVITGGASGLGAQYAQAFLCLGAKGVVILDIAEDTGRATAERLNKLYNEKVFFLKCDVSKEEDIIKAFETVVSKYKQIDVIINNAGIMNDAPAIWRTACDVNWQGLVSFTLKGIKHMRKDEGGNGGTVVNISSTAALQQFPFLPIYYGSKIAVLHFSQCISMDPFFECTGIRVMTMCLGATDTPLTYNLEKKPYESKIGKEYADFIGAKFNKFQNVESAVRAFVHMFENGGPGTVWLSLKNKPVKDITSEIRLVFKELEKLTSS